jgi:hypothetical protein
MALGMSPEMLSASSSGKLWCCLGFWRRRRYVLAPSAARGARAALISNQTIHSPAVATGVLFRRIGRQFHSSPPRCSRRSDGCVEIRMTGMNDMFVGITSILSRIMIIETTVLSPSLV